MCGSILTLLNGELTKNPALPLTGVVKKSGNVNKLGQERLIYKMIKEKKLKK